MPSLLLHTMMNFKLMNTPSYLFQLPRKVLLSPRLRPPFPIDDITFKWKHHLRLTTRSS
eukprot:UN14722